ncbi:MULTISPECIES: sensor histidine kinase [Streptomyces]|uniref:Histidine kinase n=1 Tax=Streptomyces viridochromogenes TaxID=1938 RepID=A0A0L8J9E5_STRVR|nr:MULTISPECIES: histidine kinase [Streptomyces]KOG10260.1 histidine kinase [Streptomyces viridochromogenes]
MNTLALAVSPTGTVLLVLCGAAAGLLAGAVLARRRVAVGGVGDSVEKATFRTLHTASLAAPPLRAGLTPDTARKAVRRLRPLLGSSALLLTDTDRVLAWGGSGEHHTDEVMQHARDVLGSGRAGVFTVDCAQEDCPVRAGVVVPLSVDQDLRGTLAAFGPEKSDALARATEEVARWVSVQLELAELDRARTSLIEAELRALRAQISPHFIYNSLAAIASFVRTDPERARGLLLEFAEFTRYSFRRHGDFTTLAEELRSIEQYLELERARFGTRLEVTLQIAPEVLPVALPFLCLQPLVENAVKHGLEGSARGSHIALTAEDEGSFARVVIEDNGIGMDPDRLRRILHGDGGPSSGIGLCNVDDRLRQVYGDEHGLVIETGVGAGMKVTVRIPKYRSGVHPAPR